MMPAEVPERPWQGLGIDLFSLNGQTYLLVVDYFSRFIEISILLASQKSRETIRALKSARHNTRYLEVWQWATILLFRIWRVRKGTFVHTCDVKPKDAAGQWRSRASRTDHKKRTKERKETQLKLSCLTDEPHWKTGIALLKCSSEEKSEPLFPCSLITWSLLGLAYRNFTSMNKKASLSKRNVKRKPSIHWTPSPEARRPCVGGGSAKTKSCYRKSHNT